MCAGHQAGVASVFDRDGRLRSGTDDDDDDDQSRLAADCCAVEIRGYFYTSCAVERYFCICCFSFFLCWCLVGLRSLLCIFFSLLYSLAPSFGAFFVKSGVESGDSVGCGSVVVGGDSNNVSTVLYCSHYCSHPATVVPVQFRFDRFLLFSLGGICNLTS